MKNRNLKGFTLIELMVVMIIIALLAAIAIPELIHPRARIDENAPSNQMDPKITMKNEFNLQINNSGSSKPMCIAKWCIKEVAKHSVAITHNEIVQIKITTTPEKIITIITGRYKPQENLQLEIIPGDFGTEADNNEDLK